MVTPTRSYAAALVRFGLLIATFCVLPLAAHATSIVGDEMPDDDGGRDVGFFFDLDEGALFTNDFFGTNLAGEVLASAPSVAPGAAVVLDVLTLSGGDVDVTVDPAGPSALTVAAGGILGEQQFLIDIGGASFSVLGTSSTPFGLNEDGSFFVAFSLSDIVSLGEGGAEIAASLDGGLLKFVGTLSVVPEPGTGALVAMVLGGLALRRAGRRRD